MSINSRLAKIESIIKLTSRGKKKENNIDLSALTIEEIRILLTDLDEKNKTYTARAKELLEKIDCWEEEEEWVLKQG